MKRYSTLVIFREDFEPLSVDVVYGELEALLEPYSECFIPDGATNFCHCVTSSAEKLVLEKIDQFTGDFINNLLDEMSLVEEWNQYKQGEKVSKDVAYTLEKISRVGELISSDKTYFMLESVRKYFPLQTPDSECRWCKGTGRVRAIFNPNRKFDMWYLNNNYINALNTVYANDNEGLFTQEAAHSWLKQQLKKTDDIVEDFRYQAVLAPGGKWHSTFDRDEYVTHEDKVEEVIRRFPGHYVITCQMSY